MARNQRGRGIITLKATQKVISIKCIVWSLDPALSKLTVKDIDEKFGKFGHWDI